MKLQCIHRSKHTVLQGNILNCFFGIALNNYWRILIPINILINFKNMIKKFIKKTSQFIRKVHRSRGFCYRTPSIKISGIMICTTIHFG